MKIYHDNIPPIIASHFTAISYSDIITHNAIGISKVNGNYYIYFSFGEDSELTTSELANNWLKTNNVTVYYQLETPVETSLTSEEIAEIEKLHTFYPVTNISNDADCGMKVKYIVDSKKYIDNKLALQAKAREEEMMAMLWAQQIMLGKKTYAQVPRLLKEKVKEILIDSGCEDLVVE